MISKQEKLLLQVRINKLFNNDLGRLVIKGLKDENFITQTQETNDFIMDEGRRRLIQYFENIVAMHSKAE